MSTTKRNLIVGLVGVAATLASLVQTAPVTAASLFTCEVGVEDYRFALFALPWAAAGGLSHTPRAQKASLALRLSACSNGDSGEIIAGNVRAGLKPVATFPPRPLGCPVAWGGAGPDYPSGTPVLFGADGSVVVGWAADGASKGLLKVKQGATGERWRLVVTVTSGKYAAPAGRKTKLKAPLELTPRELPAYPGDNDTYSCTDDSDPLGSVWLNSTGEPATVVEKA